MRKKILWLVISALLLTGSTTVVVKFVLTPISVFTVLEAHGGYNNKERSRFTQNATLTYYPHSADSPRRERKLRLSVDHSIVRFEKTGLNKDQRFWYNGQILVRTTFHVGTRPEVKVLNVTEANKIKFQMATFGLAPVLKRLSDPSTQVVYVGATAKGNQFQVNTADGPWFFYTKPNHLIDRLEVRDITITYGDYRTVDGLNLPFYQQVRKGATLIYEIRFDTFDFNPCICRRFFQSDLL